MTLYSFAYHRTNDNLKYKLHHLKMHVISGDSLRRVVVLYTIILFAAIL